MQKQLEDERLQRLVQEEAVKFLWKEVGTSFFILVQPKPAFLEQ